MQRLLILKATFVVTLCLAMIPAHVFGESAPQFSRWFEDATMRVDYHHYGDAKSARISLDEVIREGIWPGPKGRLTGSPPYGQYRFVVEDAASGTTLFEQGYGSLFGEWQTTEEAGRVTRVFHESVRFPYPLKPVVLKILARNRKGKLDKVFSQRIDPSSYLVRKGRSFSNAEVVVLHEGGVPETTLDIVFLADGYSEHQRVKAKEDLARFAQVFLATRPFSGYKGRIGIRGVIPRADSTGPDEPRKGLHQGSPLGTTFNTFESARYLTTLRNREVRDLAGLVPYDALCILVNSSRYGGAGIYNFFAVFVSDNEFDEYVFIHEFGHSFAGLGDEYYSSSVAYSDFYPKGVEPWEPNITALLRGAKGVKWRDLVASDTPIPTPPEEKYSDSVGVFEGAGYSAKGLYRPALDCKMFSKRDIDFCPVCMNAMVEMIRFYTE